MQKSIPEYTLTSSKFEPETGHFRTACESNLVKAVMQLLLVILGLQTASPRTALTRTSLAWTASPAASIATTKEPHTHAHRQVLTNPNKRGTQSNEQQQQHQSPTQPLKPSNHEGILLPRRSSWPLWQVYHDVPRRRRSSRCEKHRHGRGYHRHEQCRREQRPQHC